MEDIKIGDSLVVKARKRRVYYEPDYDEKQLAKVPKSFKYRFKLHTKSDKITRDDI